MPDEVEHAASRTLAAPTAAGERNLIIDILRGFAVFGILLVNFPGTEAARGGGVDDVIRKLLALLVSGKFYTTFSFLFGLGFALQLLRAQARGQWIVPVYLRRLLALFLIGLAHAILVWPGDVLLYYAVMGCFLIPLRKCPAKVLLPLAFLVLAGDYCVSISERPYWVRDLVPRVASPESEQQVELDRTLALNEIREAYRRLGVAVRTGTYPEAVAARADAWRFSNRFLFRYIWPSSFAMFLVGLAVGRAGLLSSPRTRRKLIGWVMGAGFAVFLLTGLITVYGQELLGALYFKIHWKVLAIASTLNGPAGSLFYMAALVLLLAHWPQWVTRLAPLGAAGRMPLTNYLTQSVAGTFLYYGYGLNMRLTLGKLSGLLVAVCVYAVQILISRWWLNRFQFGPCEWLWRTLTYVRLQPMRRIPPAAHP
jgi:uncharacterized protein